MKCICIKYLHQEPSIIRSNEICDYDIYGENTYDVVGVWRFLDRMEFDNYFQDYDLWMMEQRDKKLE